MPSNQEAIQKAIEEAKDKIHDVDMNVVGTVLGVSQAIDEMRRGLDQIDECLRLRDYDKPSGIGYNEIAHSFVFLQRSLAGLQDMIQQKEELISDIAVNSGVGVYEEVAPFVHKNMGTMQILTDEERDRNKELSKKSYEKLKARLDAAQNRKSP